MATLDQVPYKLNYTIAEPGNYTFTAKATDNWGAVSTSEKININVAVNQPPAISFMDHSNRKLNVSTDVINFEAAQDPEGRIVQKSFYKGATLLTDNERR